jgi:chorismate mutase
MSPEMIEKFDALVKKLEKKLGGAGSASAGSLFPGASVTPDPLLNELVVSMLLWESSISHAAKAIERIDEELVDLNELRVCLPEELASIMGARMPKSVERAQRLIAVLNEIYERENELSLASLGEMNKRDAQEYLSSIDGLPVYASARVILFGMDWHAFPLDERLAKLLSAEGVISQGESVEHQNAQLERGVRASDSARAYSLVEHWAQNERGSSRSSRSRSKAGGVKGATS